MLHRLNELQDENIRKMDDEKGKNQPFHPKIACLALDVVDISLIIIKRKIISGNDFDKIEDEIEKAKRCLDEVTKQIPGLKEMARSEKTT